MKTKFLISNGRGTVITPEGKRMLDIAQDVVRTVRSMDDYTEEADAYSGVVRLAMPDTIADYIGMREVGEFIRKYPDLSFENNITNECLISVRSKPTSASIMNRFPIPTR